MSDYSKERMKEFKDFIGAVSSKELGLFILDAKYTSDFNHRMKELIEEIKDDRKVDIELSVLFNTEGEIVVIDEYLIGEYISDIYHVKLCKYYKVNDLDILVKKIGESSDKSKEDFIKVSYFILYETLEEIFEVVKYKTDLMSHYKQYFGIGGYENEDKGIIIPIFMILNDIIKYINFEESYLKKLSNLLLKK